MQAGDHFSLFIITPIQAVLEGELNPLVYWFFSTASWGVIDIYCAVIASLLCIKMCTRVINKKQQWNLRWWGKREWGQGGKAINQVSNIAIATVTVYFLLDMGPIASTKRKSTLI